MNTKTILLLLLIALVYSQDCEKYATRDDCVKGNESLDGKKFKEELEKHCCWNTKENVCVIAKDANTANDFSRWRESGYDCGTKADICENKNLDFVGTKDYEKCTDVGSYFNADGNQHKCCYVGDGRFNRCLMLDTSTKKTYKITKYFMRMIDENYDGDYKIKCSAFGFNKFFVALVAILFSFAYLI